MSKDAEAMFGHALAAHPVALSAAGVARRDAMRAGLVQAVNHRRQVRHGLRAALGLMLLLAGSWLCWPARPGEDGVRIDQIRDQPGILAELAIQDPGTVRIEVVADDETLCQLLEAAHAPSGLIRVPGRLIVESAATGAD